MSKKRAAKRKSIPQTDREIRAMKRALVPKKLRPKVPADDEIDFNSLRQKFATEFPNAPVEAHLQRIEDAAAAVISRRGFSHLLVEDRTDPENIRFDLSEVGLRPQRDWDVQICAAVRLLAISHDMRSAIQERAKMDTMISMAIESGRLFCVMWTSSPEQEQIRDAGLRQLSAARRKAETLSAGTAKQQIMDRLQELPLFDNSRVETLKREFKKVNLDNIERYIRKFDEAMRDAGY